MVIYAIVKPLGMLPMPAWNFWIIGANKMMKGLIAALLLPLLVACDNSTASSPLVGNWITESCEQMKDANDQPLDYWVRGLYEFSPEGKIRLGLRGYSDSNCQAQVRYDPPSSLGIPFTFEDLGEAFLQEGIDGRGLRVTVGSALLPLEVSGYYIIDNDRVCFSEAFRFYATGAGVSEIRGGAIDFDNCLRQGS